MTSTSLIPFQFDCNRLLKFQFGLDALRAWLDEQGSFWFIATDVCDALRLGNPAAVVKRLDEDEVYPSLIVLIGDDGRGSPLLAISESGFYDLILTSRRLNVKPLYRWIAGHVTGIATPIVPGMQSLLNAFSDLLHLPEYQRKRLRKRQNSHGGEISRRARLHFFAHTTDVTSDKIADMIKRSKGRCYWCGKKIQIAHIDHIMPLSKGGEHMMYNLCVSCARCNLKKSSKHPQEWGVLF